MSWLLGKITGNPMLLLWIAGVAFLAGVASGGGTAWKVQGWRLEAVQSKFDGFVATVKAQGEAAEEDAKRIEAQQKANLKEITDGLKRKQAAAIDRAVRNYAARYPADAGVCDNASGNQVPPITGGQQNDDGASEKPLVIDADSIRAGFIRDCATDAATLDTWQSWGRLNNIPIE
jgi:hypothetical protein